MKDVFHVVPMAYDDEGFPFWKTPLTPSSNTRRAMVLALPVRAIPVIFVPGVMGSNLKLVTEVKGLGKAEDIAWRPDAAGVRNTALTAATRQQLLDPANTVVDKRIAVDGTSGVADTGLMSLKGAESRGWGGIYWKSYGPMLTHLDSVLNAACFYDPYLDKVLVNACLQPLLDAGIAMPGQPPLTLQRAELESMTDYWYPVHAVGYNWLQSNEDAGRYLAGEIDNIMALYRRRLRNPEACQKVILLTHSMGGLVARAAVHPAIGKAEAHVLGIVHGVMPAIGAAAAYKRMRTGFEHGEIDWFSLGNITAELGGQAVAGRNGRNVTAVLGHAPGGLQLLPNKAYQPEGWLKVNGVDPNSYVVPMHGDPYATIYREQKKWWRLINPAWLDPANKFEESGPKSSWNSFDKALLSAEKFHEKLGHHYHPNTYCFHGADARHHPSYGTVTWQKAGFPYQGALAPSGHISTHSDMMRKGLAFDRGDDATEHVGAELGRNVLVFAMSKAVDAGDGTVAILSGAAPQRYAPNCVRAQLAVAGIDHQGAYSTDNETVMQFIFYSVCKIAGDAP